MSNKKEKTEAPKKFFFELSWQEAAGWLGVFLVASTWFFVFGVMVGRGLVPTQIAQKTVQQELLEARQLALEARSQEYGQEKTELNFHEALLKDSRQVSHHTREKNSLEVTEKQAAKYKTANKKPSLKKGKAAVDRTGVVKNGLAGKKIFAIQVAALQDGETARKLARELKKAGHATRTIKVTLSSGSVWFRVRCGAFASRIEAASTLAALKKMGHDPILVKRDNK